MKLDDLKDIKIPYKETLNLPKNITIGIEIEFISAWNRLIKSLISNYEGWINKFDCSVSTLFYRDYFGGEINSPILTDTKANWEALKDVCQKLKISGARINENCGGHIHIGKQILDCENYLNLIKLWYMYENIIYRFSYGEYEKERKLIHSYAQSNRSILYDIITHENYFKRTEDILTIIKCERKYGLNFQNLDKEKQTFEFRCPNSTLNPVIWQNNVNFFVNLLKICNDVEIDEDKLNYKLKAENNIRQNIKEYNKIDLNEAIELADIVFQNEEDKLYFLKQYVKDGKDKNTKFIKTKKFTMTK